MNLPALSLNAIQGQILLVRGQKVLLDSTLATLHGIETRRLNEQVRRNRAQRGRRTLVYFGTVKRRRAARRRPYLARRQPN